MDFWNMVLIQIKDIVMYNVILQVDISKEITIEFKINETQKTYLKKIIKDLYESSSIDSENMEEFLKLTVFIVLYEYDKNKQSLKDFYNKNKEEYKNNKNKISS